MATQSPSQDFGPLDAKANTIILNGRDGCLWDARQLSQPILTQLLELSHDADGLTNRNFDTALSRTEL